MIVQWALLVAVVERAAMLRHVDDALIGWARNQYEFAIEAAHRQIHLRSALSTSVRLNEWAVNNDLEIGSIEPTVPVQTNNSIRCLTGTSSILVSANRDGIPTKAPIQRQSR